MGDSDDEYDRKRRDKFRGERADPPYRGPERVPRPRDDWVDRGDSWSRPRPREYRPGVRDRGYSPGMDPGAKRMRQDYYGDGFFNHPYQPYHAPHRGGGNFFREPPVAAQAEGQQPPMMSFKAFLATQDDNISDSEAIEKYNDYKLEFQRQQLNEFFVAHKDDEWFRLKYHPEDSVKRKEEQMAALKKRVKVYMDLMNTGKIGVSIDCAKTNELLKLLDTVVIKLEDGTDEDLEALDQEYLELEEKLKPKPLPDLTAAAAAVKTAAADAVAKETVGNKENGEAASTAEEGEIGEAEVESKTKVDETEIKKGEENSADKDGDKDKEEDEKMEVDEAKEVEEDEDEKEAEDKGAKEEPKAKEKKRKRSFSGSSSSSSSSSDTDEDDHKDEDKKSTPPPTAESSTTPGNKDDRSDEAPPTTATSTDPVDPKPTSEEAETVPTMIVDDDPKPAAAVENKPKSLHRTTSIFLRNLAPTITRQEVEAVCARYDGFLRVALADPQPERRWLRRGWVTFKRDSNIKEICWNLNNIRLRDCELGAIVNRDLSRRIRPVNGIVAHKQVVRSDIRISAKVTLHLDNKVGLWLEESEQRTDPQPTFGLVSNNPILHNITDYLIEEASAEEEELLGLEPTSEAQDATGSVERDDTLISVLDKIILYLRIVHSVDYYNHCEYPNEDEMPNRCGILHARGPPPTSKTDITQFIGQPIESKMANFLPEKSRGEETNKNEAKLVSLSLKDVDTEIDKFVQANTRELAKDKWLCPLSGKKFKGPDFVRKHIFNKHAEKIEEVKKEVEFFNNYLKDAKRPMLAEAPQPKREDQPPAYSHPAGYGGGGGSFGGYGRMPPYYGGYSQRSRGYAPRSRGGGPSDFRPVIHYRDLDAPREPEEFI